MVNLNSKVRLNNSNGLSLMINASKDLIYLYLQLSLSTVFYYPP